MKWLIGKAWDRFTRPWEPGDTPLLDLLESWSEVYFYFAVGVAVLFLGVVPILLLIKHNL